ncbi:MAG: GDSL-type esterase/lipase family protein [Desulfofustis sp.]|nr:GDSL-type esterase/lipase family protein [Desulfofustis sp.]
MNGFTRPLILLLGDSLIDYGEWHLRLPDYRVISRGVPGERTEELLRRLPVQPQVEAPDALVLMSGTNNIVFGDFGFIDATRQILIKLRKRFVGVPILVTSLLPYRIPGIASTIQEANRQLRRLCDKSGSIYLDVCRHFENSPDRLFDYDGVHLSNGGYRIWASVLDEYLRNLLAKAPD